MTPRNLSAEAHAQTVALPRPTARRHYAFGRQYRKNGNLNRMRCLAEGTLEECRRAAADYLRERRDLFNEGMLRLATVYDDGRTVTEVYRVAGTGAVVRDDDAPRKLERVFARNRPVDR